MTDEMRAKAEEALKDMDDRQIRDLRSLEGKINAFGTAVLTLARESGRLPTNITQQGK